LSKKGGAGTDPGYRVEITNTNLLQLRIGAGVDTTLVTMSSPTISINIWYVWGISVDRDGDATIFLYNLNTATLSTFAGSVSTQAGSLSNAQTLHVARN